MIDAAAKQKNEAMIGGAEKFSVWFKRFFPGAMARAIRSHPLKKLRKLGFLRADE
jgi:hypothetical protein